MDEVARGHKFGPFSSPPFSSFKCSPVNLIPKCNSDKSRLIHNLSHPFAGNSVNALVSKEEATVQYEHFGEFLVMVCKAGRGAELVKMDIADAYKHIIVHPDFWQLLGIHTGEKGRREFFVEATLPFGHQVACQIFSKFGQAVKLIAQKNGADANVFQYIDDYVVVGLWQMPVQLGCFVICLWPDRISDSGPQA